MTEKIAPRHKKTPRHKFVPKPDFVEPVHRARRGNPYLSLDLLEKIPARVGTYDAWMPPTIRGFEFRTISSRRIHLVATWFEECIERGNFAIFAIFAIFARFNRDAILRGEQSEPARRDNLCIDLSGAEISADRDKVLVQNPKSATWRWLDPKYSRGKTVISLEIPPAIALVPEFASINAADIWRVDFTPEH